MKDACRMAISPLRHDCCYCQESKLVRSAKVDHFKANEHKYILRTRKSAVPANSICSGDCRTMTNGIYQIYHCLLLLLTCEIQ